MDGSGQPVGAAAVTGSTRPGPIFKAPSSAAADHLGGVAGTHLQPDMFATTRVFILGERADPSWVGAFGQWAETPAFGDRAIIIIGSPPAGLSDRVLCRSHSVDATFPDAILPWLANLIGVGDMDVSTPPRGIAPDEINIRFAVRTLDDVRWCSTAVAWLVDLPTGASIGFSELLMNAVEHGNLELSFDEKTEFLSSGKWHDELMRRLALPDYCDRLATVSILGRGDSFEIRIRDEGPGFDWQSYLGVELRPDNSHHGRGIAMAGDCGFASLRYIGCGNEVVLEVRGSN